MAFTKEEIESGSVDIFDHIKVDASIVDIKSLIRLLDFIPLVEQRLLDMLIERLQEGNLWRHLIKAELTKFNKSLDKVTNEIYKKIDYSGENTTKSFDEALIFGMNMVDKIAGSLLEFQSHIEKLTNASGDMTAEEVNNYILSNATFISKLSHGDKFIFLDPNSTNYIEYTFDKIGKIGDEIIAYYTKYDSNGVPVTFTTTELLDVVIPCNILSINDAIELIKEYKNNQK